MAAASNLAYLIIVSFLMNLYLSCKYQLQVISVFKVCTEGACLLSLLFDDLITIVYCELGEGNANNNVCPFSPLFNMGTRDLILCMFLGPS